MLPNGLFRHLFGPIEGRHNDTFTLAKSGLMDECALHAKLPGILEHGSEVGEVGGGVGGEDTSTESQYLQLFGDPAYGLTEQLISPFPKLGLTDD